jgi:hypothetical protein
MQCTHLVAVGLVVEGDGHEAGSESLLATICGTGDVTVPHILQRRAGDGQQEHKPYRIDISSCTINLTLASLSKKVGVWSVQPHKTTRVKNDNYYMPPWSRD